MKSWSSTWHAPFPVIFVIFLSLFLGLFHPRFPGKRKSPKTLINTAFLGLLSSSGRETWNLCRGYNSFYLLGRGKPVNPLFCVWRSKGFIKDIFKADHEYGEWSIVKKATTEVASIKERVCSICGNKETSEIPKKETPVTELTPKPAQYRFSDVQDPTYPYFEAIYWAAEKGITGYNDGNFGIKGNAHVATHWCTCGG